MVTNVEVREGEERSESKGGTTEHECLCVSIEVHNICI